MRLPGKLVVNIAATELARATSTLLELGLSAHQCTSARHARGKTRDDANALLAECLPSEPSTQSWPPSHRTKCARTKKSHAWMAARSSLSSTRPQPPAPPPEVASENSASEACCTIIGWIDIMPVMKCCMLNRVASVDRHLAVVTPVGRDGMWRLDGVGSECLSIALHASEATLLSKIRT